MPMKLVPRASFGILQRESSVCFVYTYVHIYRLRLMWVKKKELAEASYDLSAHVIHYCAYCSSPLISIQ